MLVKLTDELVDTVLKAVKYEDMHSNEQQPGIAIV